MKSIIDAYHRMIQPIDQKVELTETTVPEELHHIPESWDHHGLVSDETHEKMREALTHGSFTHFPLDTSQSDADADVVEHLTNHGYQIKDYRAGLATKKTMVGAPERGIPLREKHVEEKIGSVLEKTKAPDHIKSAFANDPVRQSAKAGGAGLHVVIGTSPLAIAGMTTGTAWKDQSCMNLQGGAYKHMLKVDSEHGTHVAFLVHGNDETAFKHGEPSNPIARIALKPFHAEDDKDETIFRPENRQYGDGSSHFNTAVHRWATENYPAQPGKKYEKNTRVYDDTDQGPYEALDESAVKHRLESNHPIVHENGAMVDHHVVESAMKHLDSIPPEDHVRKIQAIDNISRIGNLTTQHVAKLNKLIGSNDPATKHDLAYRHGDKLSTAAIEDHAAAVGVAAMSRKTLMSPKLPDHIIDKLDINQYQFVRRSKLKDHHLDKVVDYALTQNYPGGLVRDLKTSFKPHHISRMIEESKSDSRSNFITHLADAPGFTKDIHDRAVKVVSEDRDPDYGERMARSLISRSKHSTLDDLDHINASRAKIDGIGNIKIDSLMHNPDISPEAAKAVKDKYISTLHPNQKYMLDNVGGRIHQMPEHISKHLTDDDYTKMVHANIQGNFTSAEHSNRYLDHQLEHVMKMDKSLADHIDKHGESEDDEHLTRQQDLHDDLHEGMHAYHASIDNHIDTHVDDNAGYIKDHSEFEKTRNRINDLSKSAAAYNTPHNTAHWSDREHWMDNFGEAESRLDELEINTEDRHGGW